MKPPIRYAGGKTRAVKHILPLIPQDIPRLVSPFIGGGAVEIAFATERNKPVIAYDIFEPLVNYWRIQLHNAPGLAHMLSGMELDKETYAAVKGHLKKQWDSGDPWTCPHMYHPVNKRFTARPSYLWACYYWYNHNLSYGPGFLGWISKIYQDRERYQRMVSRVRDFKCKKLKVKLASFEEVLPKHTDDFLYCDPPYYLGKGSKMFKGIYPQRNFPVHHEGFKHELLRDLLLKKHKGGFVLSYNDCPTIRRWYKGCKIIKVGWHYSLGQGETRVGKHRKAAGNDHVKKSHEILIIRYGGGKR